MQGTNISFGSPLPACRRAQPGEAASRIVIAAVAATLATTGPVNADDWVMETSSNPANEVNLPSSAQTWLSPGGAYFYKQTYVEYVVYKRTPVEVRRLGDGTVIGVTPDGRRFFLCFGGTSF